MKQRASAAWAALALLATILPANEAQGGEEDFPEADAVGLRYMEAVNSGDAALRAETARALFAEALIQKDGEARVVAQMDRLAKELGVLEFHHAEVSAYRTGKSVRYHLHVFARATGDQRWRDLQFRLDDSPPYKIQQLVFIANVAEPVHLPNGVLTDPQVVEWLSGYIDRLVEAEDLSGALLIAIHDQPVLERYFGFADSARVVPCSAKTRFNLGSGNKMFTALAAALLVEEGKLRFDTPLDRFFPSFPDAAWAKKCTVGHLLSHTSGVREYWTEAAEPQLRSAESMRDILPIVEAAGVAFEPGANAVYSNSNFILAGLIVEQVSGMDYHDFVRERILARCNMTETGAFVRDGSVADLAVPLTGAPNAWKPAGLVTKRGTAAGGGYSTARDVLKFGRALLAGKVVSAATLGEMTRSHTDAVEGAQLDYGYGFIREQSADRVFSYGHGGIASGVNFEFRYFPASDMTLIAFSNQDNGAYDSLRKTATKLITEER